jgi:serine phosphatase RsbU (regulator of sigma subunit)
MSSGRTAAAAGPTSMPLPASLGPLPGIDLQSHYHSVRRGGDFFDAAATGSRVILLLTDIAGRRASALGIAAVVQAAFHQHVNDLFRVTETNESEAISVLIREVNSAIMEASGQLRSSPTFLGCYNLRLGVLTFISAGCYPPIFCDSSGTRALEGGGLPLGLFTHMTHEPAVQVFEPGAKMLLVTKGVVESRQGRTEFGQGRLMHLLERSNGQSTAEFCETVLNSAHAFRSRRSYGLSNILSLCKPESYDDLTAVALVRAASAKTQQMPEPRTIHQ